MNVKSIQLSAIFIVSIFCLTNADSIAQTIFNTNPNTYELHMIFSEKPANKNKAVSYFQNVACDIVNDGIHSITDIPATFKNMFTIPFRKENQISTGISLGFMGSSFFIDEKANEFLRDEWEPQCSRYVPKEQFPIPPIKFGLNRGMFFYDDVFLAVAEYGYFFGLLIRHDRFRTLCFNLMQSTAYSFFFAQSMKALTGRARPWRAQNGFDHHDPWEWGHTNTYFGNGGEYNSFPSFHATYYFSYWTIIMDYLGYRWSGPIMASLFYFQDRNHYHWFSDMVAGGILGYWLASGVLENSVIHNRKKSTNISLMIFPMNGNFSVHVAKSW